MPAAQSTLANLRTRLQRAVWQLHERARADRYRPSFERARLLEILQAHRRHGGFVGSVDEFARHLRHRSQQRFVLDEALFADESARGRAQRWTQQACVYADQATRTGLPIFSRSSPPLDAGYPWHGVQGEPRDVLLDAHPHRFAFLPRLVLAILGGGYTCTALVAVLEGWMRFAVKRPELAYISTFVVTQRLIALTCALYFLRALPESTPDEPQLRLALARIVGQDVEYLLPRLGTSFPNGHLLTDRFAGWFATCMYPELVGARLDIASAEALFWSELERQTYADGGGFEHAVHYHGLAAEMALLWLLISRRQGREPDRGRLDRVRKMLELQVDLSGPDGDAPAIGDGIEDPMIPLDGALHGTAAAMREVYRMLFDAGAVPLRAGHPAHERAFWLLAGETAAQDGSGRRSAFGDYPQAGIFVFADDDENTRCTFRTGLRGGSGYMPGHMHADFLSFSLTLRGRPLLVDAGTYCYRNEATIVEERAVFWRRHFAGQNAHNGIVIGGRDPLGPIAADFREGTVSSTVEHDVILRGSELAWIEARMVSDSVYGGLVRGMVHVRGRYIVVYNLVDQAASHEEVCFPLQFDSAVDVMARPDSCIEARIGENIGCEIVYSAGLALADVLYGSVDPVGGWVSPRYAELKAAPQALLRQNGGVRASAFVLGLDPTQRVTAVQVDTNVDGPALAIAVEQGGAEDLLLLNRGEQSNARRGQLVLDGRLLWMREPGAGSCQVKGLRVTGFSAGSGSVQCRYAVEQPQIAVEFPLG